MNEKQTLPVPNLNGPESVPLRNYVDHFEIVVSIYHLDSDKPYRVEYIDYGNAEHRRWLGKVTFWACTNRCTVETMSRKDYEQQ